MLPPTNLDDGSELKIGLASTQMDGRELASMAAGALETMHAQGNLHL